MRADSERISRRLVGGWLCLCAVFLSAPPAIGQEQSQAARERTSSRNREEAVREKWQRVGEVFSLAGVVPGAKVADIGAGDGFLTVRLARAVGPTGRVYAVDIVPRVLEALRARVREERLDNVEVVEGTTDDPRLPYDTLDAAIFLYAYHEMNAHDSMLRHVRRALKPTGRLVLIEPTSRLVENDRVAERKADVLSAQFAEDDLRQAGFHVAELRDPFATELFGRSLQWLIVAHRAPGVLLTRTRTAGRAPAPGDGREVVAPPGAGEDITAANLRMSVDDVRKRVESARATIIDLRSAADYRTGHIPGAVLMLPGQSDQMLSKIASRAGPVFLYCS